jgi:hypothetical protein
MLSIINGVVLDARLFPVSEVGLVSNVQATTNFETLFGVICFRGEYRCAPGSRPYAGQSFCALAVCADMTARTIIEWTMLEHTGAIRMRIIPPFGQGLLYSPQTCRCREGRRERGRMLARFPQLPKIVPYLRNYALRRPRITSNAPETKASAFTAEAPSISGTASILANAAPVTPINNNATATNVFKITS